MQLKKKRQRMISCSLIVCLLLGLLPQLSLAAAQDGESPFVSEGNIVRNYIVNDDFEEEQPGALPAGYTANLPSPLVDGQSVEVAPVPASSVGNSSSHALLINDTGAGNVEMIRSFPVQTEDFIIESGFMFPEVSGTSAFIEVRNESGSRRAFEIGVRRPSEPEGVDTGPYTLVYRKSGADFALMTGNYLHQWHTIKLAVSPAAGQVTVYIDNLEIETFAFTGTGFADSGIGQVVSRTPGGGGGSYYFDDFRIYTETELAPGGLAAPQGLTGYPNHINNEAAVWLNWSTVTDAVYYNIKRSDSPGGPFVTIASVEDSVSAYLDTSVAEEREYYYVVTASDYDVAAGLSTGLESLPSNIVFVSLLSESESEVADYIPAFPGAEGGGKYVTGGRGGDVYIVDTLEDYGRGEAPIPGSLRHGVSEGNRTIVFRVGGTIHLKESLNIDGSNLTIAGQTAPGDGITVSDYTTNIRANNVIIRYISFRLTDRYSSEDDSLGARYYRDIIIDHCSFSWAVDEVVSLYDNVNTTVQWSISSESMLMTTHQKGRHGYGGIWGGRNSTYHHNLIAHSASRNPRLPTDKREIDYVDMTNNVIYNWGFASTYGGGEGDYNVRNNYYKYGPSTYKSVRSQLFSEAGTTNYDTNMYIGGNYMYGSPAVTQDNWQGVLEILDPTTRHDTPFEIRGEYDNGVSPEAYGIYQPVTAEAAYEAVLADVGASLPRRDAIDARIINEVREGLGYHINSPREVGWVYDDETVIVSDIVDEDRDGIPDDWELEWGLNPDNPADAKRTNLAASGAFAHIGIVPGYTNLEVYLNWLVEDLKTEGKHVDNPRVELQVSDSQQQQLGSNSVIEAGDSLSLTAVASDQDGIAGIEFLINGVKVAEAYQAPYTYDWNQVLDGTHYLVARAVDNTGASTHSTNLIIHANTTVDNGDWQSADIGSATGYIPGHLQVKSDGSIVLKSSGDVGGRADHFHYAYQMITGNAEIIARVDEITPTDDNAEAGVMIRESLAPGSRMSFMSIPYVKYGKQGVMLSRTSTGGSAQRIENEIFIDTPYYVRLVRFNDTLTGLVSEDGQTNWRQIGSVTISLPGDQPLYIGLAADASKPDDEVWKYNTSQFSNVAISQLPDDYPGMPAGLSVSTEGGDKQLSLSWQAAANAVSYIVKRGDVSGGPYEIISSGLTGTSFIDTDLIVGKTYYYVVSSVSAAHLESFDSSEISGIPTGVPESIYYVNDDFENDPLESTPPAYVPSYPNNGGNEWVKVVPVPATSTGNSSTQALMVADQGEGDLNLQSVSFFRLFEPQTGTVVIEADFLLAEESGNAVLMQIKSNDDSKRAFSIGVRVPTSPEGAISQRTIVYDNGSSSFHALMDKPFAQLKDNWFNVKMIMNVAAGQVTIYLNDEEIGTFDDYKDKETFKTMGIGRIYSATPGGGSGTYYIDNLKVYVEPVHAPAGLTFMEGNGMIELGWEGDEEAESYTVYRGTTPGGPYSVVEATEEQPNPVQAPTTRFVDRHVTNEVTYYYVVTASNIIGESVYSQEIAATPSASVDRPAAPQGLTAIARNTQIDLQWRPIDQALSYEIKRSDNPQGIFDEVVASGLTNPYYRVGNVANGQTYYYVVAVETVAGVSADSVPVAAAALAPAGTPDVSLTSQAGSLVLSWNPVELADYYQVKRAELAEGPYEVIASLVYSTAYTDMQAIQGQPYYYKVSAVVNDVAGLDSEVVYGRGASLQAIPDAPRHLRGEGYDGQIHLNWDEVQGAESYELLRSQGSGQPFSVIASGLTSSSYSDHNLTNGQQYFYAVAAYSQEGRSFASEVAAAVPAQVIVVAKDGSADYSTVQAAINAAPSGSSVPVIIRVMDGIYEEKVNIDSSKTNLHIIGESREGTVIANGDTAKTIVNGSELGTSESYTLRASGANLTMENLTIANTEGTGAVQAVALRADGDRGVFRNLRITGLQDTLLADKGRSYFVDSHISGSVDFIFGNSAAVFDNCVIHSQRAGYVTAASTAEGTRGYVFLNSRLTAEPGLTEVVDLGRPWRPHAEVAYVNTYMGEHIKSAGWSNWSNSENEKTARYSEYNSSGPGSKAEQRVAWSKQLTLSELEDYWIEAVLGGEDGWNPKQTVWLPNSNSSLKSIQVAGTALPGVSPAVQQYEWTLPADTTSVPVVTAEPYDAGAAVTVALPEQLPGEAVITVIAEDKTASTFTVRLAASSTRPNVPVVPVPAATPAPAPAPIERIVLGTESVDVQQGIATEDGQHVTVRVRASRLAEALRDANDNQISLITIDVSGTAGTNDTLQIEIPLAPLAEADNVMLDIQSELVSFQLSAQSLQSFLTSAAGDSDVIRLTIAPLSAEAAQLAQQHMTASGIQPLTRSLIMDAWIETAGQQHQWPLGFILRIVQLDQERDADYLTALKVDPYTGETTFVPAVFATEDGVAVARLVHSGNHAYVIAQASQTFSDIAGHWGQGTIELLASKQLLRGVGNQQFAPERAISRAEFAALLVRALGLAEKSAAAIAFTDVSADAWYAGSVAAAADAGLILGYDSGQFRPDATITREEIAVMTMRAVQLATQEITASSITVPEFADWDEVSLWAEDGVAWAINAGIMQGMGNRSFAPIADSTRGQAAQILARTLQLLSFINGLE